MATTAADALVILYEALPQEEQEEQEEVFERLARKRVVAQADQESAAAQMVRSLVVVAERTGGVPTYEHYREVQRQLAEEGVDVVPAQKLVRFFGSWRMAQEALSLSEVTTASVIEERFRKRRLDKIWRYSEEELADALAQAVEFYGRMMTVAEYEWWRQRQLALATAKGNDAFHLPGQKVMWTRYGKWPKVLKHFGYSRP